MSYKTKQTKRGLEAIDLLTNFLEKTYGKLTVSIHEKNYSSGSHGKPDIVFGCLGIEVKRVEMFVKHRFDKKERYYKHLNTLSILHDSWNRLKKWCKNNKKIPIVIAVMTCARQKPLFVSLDESYINNLQKEQKNKKWIQINSWNLLIEGEILK